MLTALFELAHAEQSAEPSILLIAEQYSKKTILFRIILTLYASKEKDGAVPIEDFTKSLGVLRQTIKSEEPPTLLLARFESLCCVFQIEGDSISMEREMSPKQL